MEPLEALVELERRGVTPERFRPLVRELDAAGLLTSNGNAPPGIAGVIELYSRGVLSDTSNPDYNRDLRRQYFPLMQRLVGAGLVRPHIPEGQQEGSIGRLVRHGFTGNFSDEIRGGLGAVGDVVRGALTGVNTNLSDSYDYNLAVERAQVRDARAQTGVGGMVAEAVGGIAMPLFRNPTMVAQGAAPAMTTGQRVQSFAGQGAGYGALGGFAEGEGGVVNRVVGAVTGGAVGGALGGSLGYGISRYGDWRAARRAAADGRSVEAAATNQNVVNEFNEAGVPVFGPAVVDSPTMQTTAESLMGSVMGGPLVARANQTATALEGRVADTIAGAGGRRAGDEMGQEVQQLLRRNLTEYTVPNPLMSEMTAAEARGISRVPTSMTEPPPRPIARPAAVPEVEPIAPRQITMDDVRVQPVHIQPDDARPNYRPFESVTLDEVNPQLAQRIAAARGEIEALARIHNERMIPVAEQADRRLRIDMNGLYRDIQADPNLAMVLRERGIRNLDDFVTQGIGPHRNALGVIDDLAAFRSRFEQITNRHQTALRPYNESLARHQEMTTGLRALETQGERARDSGWRLMVQNEHGNAVRRAEEATAQRRLAAETRAREEELARMQAAEDARAIDATGRRREQARMTAENITARRQAELDAEYQATLAERTGRWQPGENRSHSYPTELGAAYRQAELSASGPVGHYTKPIYEAVPPVRKEIKVGPVRTGFYEEIAQPAVPRRTATMNLLNEFGREARAAGDLRGWKDFDFKSDALWDHLRDRLGAVTARRLQDGLDNAVTGRLPMSGLRQQRTDVRRAAEALEYSPGNTNSRTMLERLHGAMSEDMQRMLRMAGRNDPAYTVAADQFRMIDTAYEQFATQFRRPLRALFGDQVAPEQALRKLQAAAQSKTQNLDLLRKFYRVATEKGDVSKVTGVLVSNMAEGGLPNFLKQFGGLSPEAKRIMFAGDAGSLGNALDRLYRLSKRIEPYIADGRGLDLTTLTRMSNLSLGGIAFMVNVPAAIGQAVGMHAMARLLASDKFVNWLVQMPKARNGWSPEFTRQVDRLRAIFLEEFGINDQAWNAVKPDILREVRGRPLARAS